MDAPIRSSESLSEQLPTLTGLPASCRRYKPKQNMSPHPIPKSMKNDTPHTSSSHETESLPQPKCFNKSAEEKYSVEEGKLRSAVSRLKQVYPNPDDVEEEIIGLSHIMSAIAKALLTSQSDKDLHHQLLVKRILLFGVPGTGKSEVLRQAAKFAAVLIGKQVAVFKVTVADLVSKYVGESEKLIQCLFRCAAESQPSLILLDEVESLMSTRNATDSDHSLRLKGTLLSEMEGFKTVKGVVVVATTNKPDYLDSAFRRRFQLVYHVPIPEPDQQVQIYQKFLKLANKTHGVEWDNIDFKYLTDNSEGFTGDDIKSVVMLAFNHKLKVKKHEGVIKSAKAGCFVSATSPIDMLSLKVALKAHRTSYNKDEPKNLLRWNKNYGTKFDFEDDEIFSQNQEISTNSTNKETESPNSECITSAGTNRKKQLEMKPKTLGFAKRMWRLHQDRCKVVRRQDPTTLKNEKKLASTTYRKNLPARCTETKIPGMPKAGSETSTKQDEALYLEIQKKKTLGRKLALPFFCCMNCM